MKTRVCLKYFIHGRSYLAAQYKWARSSEEAKKVNSLEQDFLKKVSVFREQALYGKEQEKWRKQKQVLKLLNQCKTYGGPVTKTSIFILEDFTLEDLQIETRFCV